MSIWLEKKFKRIQKTMKNISDVKEKAIQKPIVPAVGVNSKIKAFEKNTNGLDTEKKMTKTAYVANRSVKGITTEKKARTQAKKIPANKNNVHGSKETLNKPPLAQNLFNKVIMETPKATSEAVRPVKETNVPIKVRFSKARNSETVGRTTCTEVIARCGKGCEGRSAKARRKFKSTKEGECEQGKHDCKKSFAKHGEE